MTSGSRSSRDRGPAPDISPCSRSASASRRSAPSSTPSSRSARATSAGLGARPSATSRSRTRSTTYRRAGSSRHQESRPAARRCDPSCCAERDPAARPGRERHRASGRGRPRRPPRGRATRPAPPARAPRPVADGAVLRAAGRRGRAARRRAAPPRPRPSRRPSRRAAPGRRRGPPARGPRAGSAAGRAPPGRTPSSGTPRPREPKAAERRRRRTVDREGPRPVADGRASRRASGSSAPGHRREVGPRPRLVLRPEDEVETARAGIQVDEARLPVASRSKGESRGDHAGPRASRPPDHPDDERPATSRPRPSAAAAGDEALSRRQRHHVAAPRPRAARQGARPPGHARRPRRRDVATSLRRRPRRRGRTDHDRGAVAQSRRPATAVGTTSGSTPAATDSRRRSSSRSGSRVSSRGRSLALMPSTIRSTAHAISRAARGPGDDTTRGSAVDDGQAGTRTSACSSWTAGRFISRHTGRTNGVSVASR